MFPFVLLCTLEVWFLVFSSHIRRVSVFCVSRILSNEHFSWLIGSDFSL